jgi:hypothetical protein
LASSRLRLLRKTTRFFLLSASRSDL